MTVSITEQDIQYMIQIESGVHYGQQPPPGRRPFGFIDRGSAVLLSAPHGCRTYRNRGGQTWHDEDEYTAGIALLLSELCDVSVIATIWRTDDSDPSDSYENQSDYKHAVRKAVQERGIRWIIDLHGAGTTSPNLAPEQLIDLGLGDNDHYLPAEASEFLRSRIEQRLGPGAIDRRGYNGYPAKVPKRTIASFAYNDLHVHSVQIEMKPSVRIPLRRVDASAYTKPLPEGGPFRAPTGQLLSMLQILSDFIEYIK